VTPRKSTTTRNLKGSHGHIQKTRTSRENRVYQLLAHGRWFSPGTPASFTTKIGRHDIAEILLKVALKHQKSNQIKSNKIVKS
jgi:hypothetical protein